MFAEQYNFFEDENFYIKKLCRENSRQNNREKITNILRKSIAILNDKNEIKNAEAESIRLAYLLMGNIEIIDFVKKNIDKTQDSGVIQKISDIILQIIKEHE
ncbi:MAG: hypothetical protein M0R46_10740 [Candidatus Muirbacterium halophilum]|nr:hypothetical protein [Candidatus Muirbacterium halophilum]MCK9476390.1 hypothetical protein [Candidatus Muirbacterium halophilum]